MQKLKKETSPQNKTVNQKKTTKAPKALPKKKETAKEKAKYDDMRQIEWFPADPYND